ncbi:MTH1187 family thiamine-binding protein [Parasediminibacterium sp. JCM 36343]|uniref:thiamine-binding protein n=1 Tax=Parasediminibacterium sp. JCM 36343 TaxID=3374279 RepID=UPI00397E1DC4
MHNYIINASIQIIPVVTDKHPYEWVDEAIAIIQQSNVKYEVGPFATVLEGTYTDVMGLIGEVNEFLYQRECSEWITNLQIQIRCKGDITGAEKTDKFAVSEIPY